MSFVIIAALLGVSYFITRRMRGRPGYGRALIVTLTLAVYVALAITTEPLFALAPAAVIGVVSTLGVFINHAFISDGSPRYIPW